MAYPDTLDDTTTIKTNNVTTLPGGSTRAPVAGEPAYEDNHVGAAVIAIETVVGLPSDAADPNGSLVAQIKALQAGGGGSGASDVVIPAGLVAGGSTDNLAAINAAAAALAATGGGTLFIPPGVYKVTGTIVIHPKVRYQAVRGGTTLATNHATLPVFGPPAQTSFADAITTWAIDGFTFAPSVSRSNLVPEIASGITSGGVIERCSFVGVGTCMDLGHPSVIGGNTRIDDCGGAGFYRWIKVQNHIDCSMTRVDAGSNRVDSQMIYLTGHVEACRWNNVDLVNQAFIDNRAAFGGQAAMVIDSDLVRHNSFGPEFYLDTMPMALDASAGWNNTFDHCWFAGGKNNPLVRVYGTAKSYVFTAPKLFNAGHEALSIESGNGHRVITPTVVAAYTLDGGGDGSGPGIRIKAGCMGAIVRDAQIYKNGQNGEGHTGSASYGVYVETGAANVVVDGCTVDPAIGTGYSSSAADTSVKVTAQNFGSIESRSAAAATFAEPFTGTGTVDATHAFATGGTGTGPLVLTKTGDGWGYVSGGPGQLLVSTPRGLKIDFTIRAVGSPAEFQSIGFWHCRSADGTKYYQAVIARSSTDYHFQLYKVDPGLSSGYTTIGPDVDLTTAIGFAGGAAAFSYSCSPDGLTHMLKYGATVLYNHNDDTSTAPLSAGSSGFFSGTVFGATNGYEFANVTATPL